MDGKKQIVAEAVEKHLRTLRGGRKIAAYESLAMAGKVSSRALFDRLLCREGKLRDLLIDPQGRGGLGNLPCSPCGCFDGKANWGLPNAQEVIARVLA